MMSLHKIVYLPRLWPTSRKPQTVWGGFQRPCGLWVDGVPFNHDRSKSIEVGFYQGSFSPRIVLGVARGMNLQLC